MSTTKHGVVNLTDGGDTYRRTDADLVEVERGVVFDSVYLSIVINGQANVAYLTPWEAVGVASNLFNAAAPKRDTL